jgi:hypothetical protein
MMAAVVLGRTVFTTQVTLELLPLLVIAVVSSWLDVGSRIR